MNAHAVIEKLVADAPVLTDGAWGTELQARGLPVGEMGDVWNLHHPERVEEVARAYVDAGSRVVLTNTFRANRVALQRHPEQERVVEINRAGVEISSRAAAGRALVFASLGPSGKLLATGEVDVPTLETNFAEQATALADGGADGLVVETMADLDEARIAVTAALATGLPVVACMVFDSGKNRDRTMMGVSPEQAAGQLSAAGAHVIGANCGIGIDAVVPICRATECRASRARERQRRLQHEVGHVRRVPAATDRRGSDVRRRLLRDESDVHRRPAAPARHRLNRRRQGRVYGSRPLSVDVAAGPTASSPSGCAMPGSHP
jgi:methionine synthase I (cobalamin-dependent)